MKSKNLYFGLWLTLLLPSTCAYSMFWPCCTHTNVIEQAHQPAKKMIKTTQVIRSHSMILDQDNQMTKNHHTSTGKLDRLVKQSERILQRSDNFVGKIKTQHGDVLEIEIDENGDFIV